MRVACMYVCGFVFVCFCVAYICVCALLRQFLDLGFCLCRGSQGNAILGFSLCAQTALDKVLFNGE